jgi:ATP-GRASP peptide maturase of grasp-with-spasm system
MILIITDEVCVTTNKVIDWLLYYKADFYRVNQNSICKIRKFLLSNNRCEIEFYCNNNLIKLNQINAIWYRRGDINLSYSVKTEIFLTKLLKNQIASHLVSEIKEVRDFVYMLLDKKSGINSPNRFHANKLLCLLLARKHGLKIPNTEIISAKRNIYFNKKIITKFIRSGPNFYDRNSYAVSLTSRLVKADLEDVCEEFFPSLIQEEINKDFEIRVFFLNKRCYAMAIFSQSDLKTEVDFRNYNDLKPNRTCAYKLPNSVEKSIIHFMEEMNLNCGSLDLIKNKKNEFVFLEVNPIGQFGMVSYPCNYNLHKIIARQLIDYDKRKINKVKKRSIRI